MSAHTQGPWAVKRIANYSTPGWVLLWPHKGGQHMRRLDSLGSFTESDARLLAAAPDLLDSVKELKAHLLASKSLTQADKDAALKAIQTADTVIAATKGQA